MNKKPSRFVMWFAKITGLIPGLIFFRAKLYYMTPACPRRLPKPCILISNHTSLLDFVLYLFTFLSRNFRFLMAEVLFRKNSALSWLLYKLGGVFVDRNTCDFRFVGESVSALEKGWSVAVFPESRLPVPGETHRFKPSIAMIALQTDAPIIPVYTNGKYLKGKRPKVMIGEPIYLKALLTEGIELDQNGLPCREELYRLTEILENRVLELKAELERRAAE